MIEKLFFLNPNTSDFSLIAEFLKLYEDSCVTLCSAVKKQSDRIVVISKTNVLHSAQDIWGVLLVNKTLLHCLPFLELCDFTDFKEKFSGFLSDKDIKLVDGMKNGTDFLADIIEKSGKNSIQKNLYKLMVLDSPPEPAPQTLYNDDHIRWCSSDALEDLFELQKEYLLCEVVLRDHKLSQAECTLSLSQILKTQVVLALYSDGQAVAKANTNAIGINWVQLGGVYTNPLYRKNYYAWHLVAELCRRIQRSGKKVCLFVKEKNTAARALYSKIGFTVRGDFEIVYF